MPENLNEEVKKFIGQRIRSLLEMDLIVYFHNNPVASESAKQVASRLGKDVKEVTRTLREFEARGVVRNMATAGASIYVYAAGDNLCPIINRFVRLVSSREGRSLVYSELASKGRL
ncbi:hypothetical protein LR007_04670 [candidate division NPL-UPA2 bacterium]|nr:hypothetical protein [candidate division NPL-UPA2 bacterium]